jgi:hypothetical protein
LAAGIALAALACAGAMYLALGRWPGRPRPRGIYWMIGGVAAFYVVTATAALVFAGPGPAVATALAAFIPMTAVAIWIAGVRSKTVAGSPAPDASADDNEDPFPGMAADATTPLGATAEAHDDLSPHDLPKGHPSRPAGEGPGGGERRVTRGHRQRDNP